jgi:hypothetical protein
MPAVQAILVGLVMVLAFLASKIVAVAIERDYKGWAFPVARWTARLADSLQSSKRGSVLAEVLHAQHDENRAALPEALWHLVGAPLLAWSAARSRIRSRGAALLTERGDFLLTETGDRILLEDGDRGHVADSGDVVVIPQTATLYVSGISHGVGGSEMSQPPRP